MLSFHCVRGIIVSISISIRVVALNACSISLPLRVCPSYVCFWDILYICVYIFIFIFIYYWNWINISSWRTVRPPILYLLGEWVILSSILFTARYVYIYISSSSTNNVDNINNCRVHVVCVQYIIHCCSLFSFQNWTVSECGRLYIISRKHQTNV
jgi:hypothetical protein